MKSKKKEDKEEVKSEDSTKEVKEETVIKEINLDHKDKYIRIYSEYEN